MRSHRARARAPEGLDALLAGLATRAGSGAGLPGRWLDGYLPSLVGAVLQRGELAPAELGHVQQVAAEAARAGVQLPTLVRLYLRATALLWDRLPDVARLSAPSRDLDLARAGSALLKASDQAVSAATAGFSAARRLLVEQEAALHRELVDELLDGRGELELLAERAEHFGLHLTAGHVVAALEATSAPVSGADVALRRVEQRVRCAFPGRGVLTASREGRLVCIVADAPAAGESSLSAPVALAEVLGDLARTAATETRDWRVAVGRLRVGAGGVARSYRDAVEALDLARRLGLPDSVVLAERLLVYRVLLRDQAAMADLVDATLAPLASARGGAAPLLDVLHAWSATGGVTTETARHLHLSPRAVTYRLDRVRALTGYDAGRPDHRLTLEIAAVGARLLGWPSRPLPRA